MPTEVQRWVDPDTRRWNPVELVTQGGDHGETSLVNIDRN
jgi:hypothetical protein